MNNKNNFGRRVFLGKNGMFNVFEWLKRSASKLFENTGWRESEEFFAEQAPKLANKKSRRQSITHRRLINPKKPNENWDEGTARNRILYTISLKKNQNFIPTLSGVNFCPYRNTVTLPSKSAVLSSTKRTEA